MALRVNPATGQMEEDGTGNPFAGLTSPGQPPLAGAPALTLVDPPPPAVDAFTASQMANAERHLPPEPAAAPPQPLMAGPAPTGAPGAPPVLGNDPLAPLAAIVNAPTASAAQQIATANAVGPDVTTQRTIQTAGEKKAMAGLGAAIDDQKTIVKSQAELEAEKAKGLERIGAQESRILDLSEQSRQLGMEKARLEEQVAERQYQDATGYLQQVHESYKALPVREMWDDMPNGTAAKVASYLFAGLGQFAATMTGTENTALKVIDGALARHAQRQREKAAAHFEQHQQKVTGAQIGEKKAQAAVGAAQRHTAREEIELRERHKGMIDGMQRERTNWLLKHGATEAQLKGDEILNGLEQRKQALALENEKSLRAVVTSSNANQNQARLAGLVQAAQGGDKPFNKASEGEKSKDAYTQQALAAVKSLEKIPQYSGAAMKEIEKWRAKVSEEVGDTPVEKIQAAVSAMSGDLLKRLKGTDRDRFLAEQTAAENILRPKTGAAVRGSEYIDEISNVQRMPGDTPEMLQIKADRLTSKLVALASQTYRPGHWLREFGGAPPDAPAAAAAAPPPMTPAQEREAALFVRKNPNHPDTPGLLTVLRHQASTRKQAAAGAGR